MKKTKDLFATPKKAAITSVCIVAILAAIGGGSVLAASAIAEKNAIGDRAAVNAALADAGVDAAGAAVEHTEFEYEDGEFVYEVDFTANGIEYDYSLRASDGKVISRETRATKSQNEAEPVTGEQLSAAITLDEAKSAALADAGVSESAATFTDGHLDRDDGVLVYDIEFYTANAEYDYEINASTGALHSKSSETISSGAAGSVSGGNGYIGVEKAKSIAAAHAGVSSSEVYFTKAKLENDDGRAEYEIEFYVGSVEYEYSVDAASGAILDYDSEYAD